MKKKSIKITESQLQRVIKSTSKKPLNEMDIDFRSDEISEEMKIKKQIKVFLLHTIRNLYELSKIDPEMEVYIKDATDLMERIENRSGNQPHKKRWNDSLN